MQPIRPIDPVITFRNSQGEAVRGTLTNVQRRSLVIEIYNPYSIVQVSEVLSELTLRSGDRSVYKGKAVVTSLLNTGLMAVVSVVLSDALPRDAAGRIRDDVFHEMARPLMQKGRDYLIWIESEAGIVAPEDSVAHRNFAQSALHPLLLRAPFVYRTFAKPLGYAGDYEMVNQILTDPRQGQNTYFQIVNTLFLQCAVAQAHRNRIDILVDFLNRAAGLAEQQERQVKVLNVGCGPAVEIQRFIKEHPNPQRLSFTLVDFSQETLDYTRECIEKTAREHGKTVHVEYVHESVHDLLKRAIRRERNGMEHLLEWHLIYRDERQLESVLPHQRSGTRLYTDDTGINLFAEFQVTQESVNAG